MKIKLNILDRINISKILPREGSFITNKLVKELLDEIGFSVDEIKKSNLRDIEKEGQIMTYWDSDFEIEVELNEVVEDIIKKKLRELDETNTLPIEYNELYIKFKLN